MIQQLFFFFLSLLKIKTYFLEISRIHCAFFGLESHVYVIWVFRASLAYVQGYARNLVCALPYKQACELKVKAVEREREGEGWCHTLTAHLFGCFISQRCFEKCINKRRLAVVDVCDNRNVTVPFSANHACLRKNWKKSTNKREERKIRTVGGERRRRRDSISSCSGGELDRYLWRAVPSLHKRARSMQTIVNNSSWINSCSKMSIARGGFWTHGSHIAAGSRNRYPRHCAKTSGQHSERQRAIQKDISIWQALW